MKVRNIRYNDRKVVHDVSQSLGNMRVATDTVPREGIRH